MDRNAEREIIDKAMAAFRETTQLDVIEANEASDPPELTIRRGKVEWRFRVEVKPWLVRENVGYAVQAMGDLRGWLLITRYVTPAIAEQMRALGVAFIDAAGNAFINQPGLFIFVAGNRPKEQTPSGSVKRLFRPAGLRILYAFLCHPGLEQSTYRDIAAMTGTALGTVSRVMHDLLQMGFMVDMGAKGRRILKKKDLLEQWTVAYPQQLRPKMFVGTYKADRQDWWRDLDVTAFDAQWGGEPAAAKITQYLKPEQFTIYTGERIQELILRNKLRKDPRGDVEVVRRFWTFDPKDTRKETVHPLLVYADLIATANDRNIETARMIYERELAGLIGKG